MGAHKMTKDMFPGMTKLAQLITEWKVTPNDSDRAAILQITMEQVDKLISGLLNKTWYCNGRECKGHNFTIAACQHKNLQ